MELEIALMVVGGLIAVVGLISLIVTGWLAIRYQVYNKLENSANMSGEEIARKILDDNDLEHIKVKVTGSLLFGNSYSHYFKKVRIRRFTRNEKSITSLGIGAQKAALAILDKEGDPDMKKRIHLYPLITFGPFAFVPLITVGALLDYFIFSQSGLLVYIFGGLGLLFYVLAVVLTVTTLKTERKAQDKAYEILEQSKLINEEELAALKDLFHLYNIQYVNDIILAALELIYTVIRIAIDLKLDN
jgi:Zn-dependent membrane protease YugP